MYLVLPFDVVLHLARDHNCNVGSRERKEAHKQ